jgi:hypothetical protein
MVGRNLTATSRLVLMELATFTHAASASGRAMSCRPSDRGAASGPSRAPTGGQAPRAGGMTATRAHAAWRSLRGPNRYVLKLPASPVQWLRCTGGKFCRHDTNDQRKTSHRTVTRRHPGADCLTC